MRNPGFLFSLCTALCGCTTPTKELVWEALSPPMGPTTGGTEVQVSGKGFSQDTVVAFDGVAAETLRIEGEELLVAKLPARLGRAGFVDVQLSSPIDTILRSRAFQYYFGKVQFTKKCPERVQWVDSRCEATHNHRNDRGSGSGGGGASRAVSSVVFEGSVGSRPGGKGLLFGHQAQFLDL